MDQQKPTVRKLSAQPRKVTTEEIFGQLGKLPPQAVDLEEAVLGALMLERDALTTVIDILKPESFYKDQNQEIFRAIVDLFNSSEPIDLLTVTHRLRETGKLEFVGGPYYITELTTRVNSAANIEAHARIISEQSIKRELIRISAEIQKMGYEDTTDVFELLDQTEKSLFEISESHIRKNYADMRSLMHQTVAEIEEKKKHEGLTGVASGFTALDRVTSGWQKSDLVIIAARPGMGKTALVVSALRNAAIDFQQPVAIFSLEMSATQLVNRMISAEAELENEKIRKGQLKDFEWEQLVHKTSKLTEAPIYIDDTPSMSPTEIRARARRLHREHGLGL